MSFAKGVSKYKTLSLEQQYFNIKNCPLASNGRGEFSRDYFYWEFTAQPTPLSKTYLVLLIFHMDNYSPDVFILDQDVWDISKKKSIPHLYDSKRVKLCLYYPAYKDWDQTMPLNTTFVPWTYLWLYYYEEWLFSCEWKGGGEHPSSKNSEENDKKQVSIFNKFRKQKAKKTNKEDKAKQIIHSIYEQRRKAYIEREGVA
ncbi:MAG: hypothetical protein AB1763_02500 [Campylobacterota bacterium]